MSANDSKILYTAIDDGMPLKLAAFIVAQARHETGNYKHEFFTEGNNAFGYMYVSGAKWQLVRSGSNADNGAPIARYSSVENSVHELTDWIKRRQKEGKFPADLMSITYPQEYAKYLKNCGYYGASFESYSAALKKHYDALPIQIKEVGGSCL